MIASEALDCNPCHALTARLPPPPPDNSPAMAGAGIMKTPPTPPLRVLIVDDNPLDRADAKAALLTGSTRPSLTFEDVEQILQMEMARKKLRFSAAIEPGLGSHVLDVLRLKQVLYNDLSNAIVGRVFHLVLDRAAVARPIQAGSGNAG